jgi:hypothetical protein
MHNQPFARRSAPINNRRDAPQWRVGEINGEHKANNETSEMDRLNDRKIRTTFSGAAPN